MKINLIEVVNVLARLRGGVELEKGMQPELSLGCFVRHGMEDTGECEKCKLYYRCESFLTPYKVKENEYLKNARRITDENRT